MKPEQKVEVFLARWFALLIISSLTTLFAAYMLKLYIGGLIVIAIFVPPIIFFRKEVFQSFYYWYLMIRGIHPGGFWDFVEGVERE